VKIRSVHPEFFSDPKVAELSHDARLLYVGLWCYADDYGRGRMLPKSIEGQVFPHDVVDIQRLLWELEKRRFIRLYEAEGERFFEIPKWDDWQAPRYKSKTSTPAPGTYVSTEDLGLSQTFAEFSETVVQGEGVGEGVGEGASTAEFSAFNAKRAVEVVDQRIRAGLPVKSRTGLAKTIQADPEHVFESRRVWAHRDCEKCGGRGVLVFHPQAGGSTAAPCDAAVSAGVGEKQ